MAVAKGLAMTIGIVVVMVALVPVVYFVAGRIMAAPEHPPVARPLPAVRPEPAPQPVPELVPELVPQIDVAVLRALPLPRFARGSIPPGIDTDPDDFVATDLDESAATLRDGRSDLDDDAETLHNVAPVR